MLKAHENDFSYRFGDNGPKYLIQGPNIDLGLVVIQPGQEFQNHYHTTCEEVFYALEGEIDFYVNNERVPLNKVMSCKFVLMKLTILSTILTNLLKLFLLSHHIYQIKILYKRKIQH